MSSSDDDMASFEFEVEDFQDNETRAVCEDHVGYTEPNDDTIWIVDLAMKSPLPEGWKLYRNSKGKFWFFNPETKQLQSTRPFPDEFKGMVDKQKSRSEAPLEELAISSVKGEASESIDNALERLSERKQYKIHSLKSKFHREIQTLKEHHRSRILQIKEQQRREIDTLIKEIDSIKAQHKLMKCSSARNQYRIAVQKFVDDFETEKKFQIAALEGELSDVREQYENQLYEMKTLYERELSDHKMKIYQMRRENKEEMESLRRELELQKKAELLKFEKDMIDEKRKIIREKLQEKQHKLELCNAKIISIVSRPHFKRLKMSSPNGISLYDDPMEFCELEAPTTVFHYEPPRDSDENYSSNSTVTEIAPFASFRGNKVTFHDTEETEIIPVPVIQEEVYQYKSVFLTPQPQKIHRRYNHRRL